MQSELEVFSYYNIYQSECRFSLICVFIWSVTDLPSFSQQNLSFFLLSPPQHLFIFSTHLICFLLIPPLSQEALDHHQWDSRGPAKTKRWREIVKREYDGERGTDWRQGRESENRENENENEMKRVIKKRKNGLKGKKERQRQRERVSNYRTHSVFKASLLSYSSCGWEKRKQRKERGGEELEVQALVQFRHQAPVSCITDSLTLIDVLCFIIWK